MLNDQDFSGRRFEIGFDGWGGVGLMMMNRFDGGGDGTRGVCCFDGAKRGGRPAESRVIAEVVMRKRPRPSSSCCCPLVPVDRWMSRAGMPRERASREGRVEKEWFDTFSTVRWINTTHHNRGRPWTLSFSFARQDRIPPWLLRIPPHHTLFYFFFGYSRTPHTATDKNTPNDTDLQSNH